VVTLTLELTSKARDVIGLKDAAVMRLEEFGTVKILSCEQWSPLQMYPGTAEQLKMDAPPATREGL
jgi:hypothetical protein